jgi:hypothetical protein
MKTTKTIRYAYSQYVLPRMRSKQIHEVICECIILRSRSSPVMRLETMRLSS